MADNQKDLVVWTDKFACGIKTIDDQHKMLVDLVNNMFKHATGNEKQEKDFFNKAIQEVINYVKVHFATEEKILIATKFAGYEEHKKEHENFIRKVIENVRDYEAGKRLTLSTFTRYLRDWILSHIAYMDKQYFEYFRKIATRKEDGKLHITSEDLKKA
ncbi:MAG: bacteriohemerythrin [Treponema sp.]|jgi:hemerythrin|nr:bacteriohemerythrin [Treponema sp.]